jgi:hypothetical protein
MLIMSFYFGGRTLEKIMDMKSKEKQNAWVAAACSWDWRQMERATRRNVC